MLEMICMILLRSSCPLVFHRTGALKHSQNAIDAVFLWYFLRISEIISYNEWENNDSVLLVKLQKFHKVICSSCNVIKAIVLFMRPYRDIMAFIILLLWPIIQKLRALQLPAPQMFQFVSNQRHRNVCLKNWTK